jgi:hypothetical protein
VRRYTEGRADRRARDALLNALLPPGWGLAE